MIDRRPMQAGEPEHLFLHLGCGHRRLPGYTHIDSRKETEPDIVADVADLHMLPDRSAKVIYACHVLEHIPRPHVFCVLEEWRRVLEPGGLLRLSVPDFHVLAELYLYDAVSMWRLIGPLMGGQRNSEDAHHIAFDKEYLSWILTEAGYIHIRPWYPGQMHPVDYDDYSLARIDGRYISLNLEAVAK